MHCIWLVLTGYYHCFTSQTLDKTAKMRGVKLRNLFVWVHLRKSEVQMKVGGSPMEQSWEKVWFSNTSVWNKFVCQHFGQVLWPSSGWRAEQSEVLAVKCHPHTHSVSSHKKRWGPTIARTPCWRHFQSTVLSSLKWRCCPQLGREWNPILFSPLATNIKCENMQIQANFNKVTYISVMGMFLQAWSIVLLWLAKMPWNASLTGLLVNSPTTSKLT